MHVEAQKGLFNITTSYCLRSGKESMRIDGEAIRREREKISSQVEIYEIYMAKVKRIPIRLVTTEYRNLEMYA